MYVADVDLQGDYRAAEPHFLRALEIRRVSLGPSHPDFATSLNDLGGFYQTLGRFDEAEKCLREAVDAYESALGPNHPWVATGLNNLAELLRAQVR